MRTGRHRRWSGCRDCSPGSADKRGAGGRYRAAVASAQRLLQFFRHYPERPVELNVAVYAFNCACMTAFAFGGTSWQTPFQQVLLKLCGVIVYVKGMLNWPLYKAVQK